MLQGISHFSRISVHYRNAVHSHYRYVATVSNYGYQSLKWRRQLTIFSPFQVLTEQINSLKILLHIFIGEASDIVYSKVNECLTKFVVTNSSSELISYYWLWGINYTLLATREFSGGWRMRLALARALFTKWVMLVLIVGLHFYYLVIHRPDLLLLDGKCDSIGVAMVYYV